MAGLFRFTTCPGFRPLGISAGRHLTEDPGDLVLKIGFLALLGCVGRSVRCAACLRENGCYRRAWPVGTRLGQDWRQGRRWRGCRIGCQMQRHFFLEHTLEVAHVTRGRFVGRDRRLALDHRFDLLRFDQTGLDRGCGRGEDPLARGFQLDEMNGVLKRALADG